MSLTPTGASLGRRTRRSRLYLTYVLLTVFNVLTVSFGMVFNQRLVEANSRSIADNYRWVARSHEYSQLSDLATALDAPGNEVFETRNTLAESAVLHGALAASTQRLAKLAEESGKESIDPEGDSRQCRIGFHPSRTEATGIG
jgi:hypothetical protein